MDFDWKVVRSSFLGGVLVKVFLLLVAIIGGFLGFAPAETIRAMTPTNFAESSLLVARIIFLFLGAAALAVTIQQLRDAHWPSLYVPMEYAAIKAYEQARESQPVLAYAAERIGGQHLGPAGEEEIINYFAFWLGDKIEIYGSRPPSAKRESFTYSSGSFKKRASEYWEGHRHSPSYRSVEVKRSDLKALLADMKKLRSDIDLAK